MARLVEDWSIEDASPSTWALHAASQSYGLDLELRPLMAPVLNGEHGLSRKSGLTGAASYYYSVPRIAVRGTLRREGRALAVQGLAWLDREWGSGALAPDQQGWDWFAVQFKDGSSLMFYCLRRRDGSRDAYSAGTWVSPEGTVRPLANRDVRIDVGSHWSSPRGGRYPASWQLQVPALALNVTVRPLLANQELATSPRYWEGAVAVTGERASAAVSGRSRRARGLRCRRMRLGLQWPQKRAPGAPHRERGERSVNFSKLIERNPVAPTTPKTESPVIAAEPATVKSLYTGYIMILAAIPAVCTFLKMAFIGSSFFGLGVFHASVSAAVGSMLMGYVLSLIGVFVLALIIDALAPTFDGQKNRVQALKAAAYSYTAAWVAGFGMLLPWLGILIAIVGAIYSIYLLYLGLPHTMKSPADKAAGYTAVTVVVAIVLSWVIGLLTAGIIGTAALSHIGMSGPAISSRIPGTSTRTAG